MDEVLEGDNGETSNIRKWNLGIFGVRSGLPMCGKFTTIADFISVKDFRDR